MRYLLPLLASLAVAACSSAASGAPPASSAAPSSTAAPIGTATTAPTASPTAPAASPTWVTYRDTHLAYSLEYPAGWHRNPSGGGPFDGQVFANENVTNLRQLDNAGILLQLTIEHPQAMNGGSYCPVQADSTALQRGVITAVPATVDGIATTRYRGMQIQSDAYDDRVAVVHGGWCYSFSFGSPNRGTLASHDADIRSMLASFRFNR